MTRPCLLLCGVLLLAGTAPARAQMPLPIEDPLPETTVVLPDADDDPGDDDGALEDWFDGEEDEAPVRPRVPDRDDADRVTKGGRGADEGYTKKTNAKAISATPRLTGPTVPGRQAVKRSDGTAVPPAAAPLAVKRMIWTANRMIGRRYRYGGGHRSFADSSYDCSGAVSYALHAAALLTAPRVSGELARWGRPGNGRWVTIYANAGHVYMTIAGLRLDTSAVNDPGGLSGPRWRPAYRSSRGFHKRHPAGL